MKESKDPHISVAIFLIIIAFILGLFIGAFIGSIVHHNKAINTQSTNTSTQTSELNKEDVLSHEPSNIIESFNENDLHINGVKLGDSLENVEKTLGSEYSSTEYSDEKFKGNVIFTSMKYENLGITVTLITEENASPIVYKVECSPNDQISLTRELSNTSNVTDILGAFKPTSILLIAPNSDNTEIVEKIYVGYPDTDPIYNINGTGKLIFGFDKDETLCYISLTKGLDN